MIVNMVCALNFKHDYNYLPRLIVWLGYFEIVRVQQLG